MKKSECDIFILSNATVQKLKMPLPYDTVGMTATLSLQTQEQKVLCAKGGGHGQPSAACGETVPAFTFRKQAHHPELLGGRGRKMWWGVTGAWAPGLKRSGHWQRTR